MAGYGGHIMRNLPNDSRVYWPDGAYAPKDPGGTTADRQGWCRGDKRKSCVRDLRVTDEGGESRFSFQFLADARAPMPLPPMSSAPPTTPPSPQSNSTFRLNQSGKQMGSQAPFAFVQVHILLKPLLLTYLSHVRSRPLP